MSRHTWSVARRYVVSALVLGVPLVLRGSRRGWALLGLSAMISMFFRDPERIVREDPHIVYSAADGRVVRVEHNVPEPWLPGGTGTRVTVFISLTNVHVTRCPIAGTITRSEQLGRGRLPALLRRADSNRRDRVALVGVVPLVIVQVAGALARNITNWRGVGEHVAAGERLGVIHFGSRTDIVLPSGVADVLVSPGARVRAGVTPIAHFRTTR
jgi:phosphatidylserine decarboxylase